jgi:3-hydroxyisobutyrate dehydrogenase-like beta-hydroxyacid dehydrogenase
MPTMLQTIAVVATGEMGSAVGAALARRGYRVITDLTGRSDPSRRLAADAGIVDVGGIEPLVQAADVVLSIVPPAAAPSFAHRVASELERSGARPVFVDCNAVSPATLAEIAAPYDALGAPFVDVGIVGPAPRADRPPTRFYVSGAARSALLTLDVPEIRVIDLGDVPGRASALKMCYAALNKGFDALLTSVLLAAERLGVRPELADELTSSQPEAAARAARRLPTLAATAERYVPEMREIAATFAAAGITPEFHRGAEWLYATLARTPFAAETRLTAPADRSLDEALAVFLDAVEPKR